MRIEKYHIHCMIGILLMFGFGFLPPFGSVTPMGMKIIGIFLSLVYLWSTVSIMWPALLGLAALVIVGYTTLGNVLITAFGSEQIVMLIFILALLGVIDQQGVNNYICKWFLTRKVCQKSPWLFLMLWLLAAFFVGLFGNTVFAIFLLWGILYQMADVLGVKPFSKFTNAVLVGTVVSAAAGATILPFKDMPIFALALYQQMFSGVELPQTVPFIAMMLIIAFLTIIGYLLLMRFVFRVDVSCLKTIDLSQVESLGNLPAMNGLQKFLLGYMLVFMLFLCVPAFLPTQWLMTIKLKALGSSGITIVFFALLCLIRRDGKSVVDFQVLSKDKVVWDLIFLMGAGVTVAGALVSDATGVKTFLAELLTPLLAGCSPFLFVAVLLIAASLVTNFSQNGVTLMLFMMVGAIFTEQIAYNTATMVTLLQFCCNMAFVLPSASVMGAILHGNTGWLKTKDIYFYTIMTMVMIWFVMISIGIPLGNVLYR